jgi:hypothetical protein
MQQNLVQIRSQAELKEEENYKFRAFLKGKCKVEPEQIDERVFVATRRVWAGIDYSSKRETRQWH